MNTQSNWKGDEFGGGSLKLLVVSDSSEFLDEAKSFLGGRFDVETAGSVGGALEKLDAGDFDATVSGHSGSGVNALEFLRTVRNEIGKSIPFIIFSGEGSADVAIDALNSGANGYLVREGDREAQYENLSDIVAREAEDWRSLRKSVEQGERLDTLFEKVLEGIVLLDAESFEIMHANSAALDMLELESLEDIEGRAIYEFVVPEEKKRFDTKIEDEVFDGGVMEGVETKLMRDSGEEFWASFTGRGFEMDGRPVAVLSFRDITEQKEVEEREDFLHSLLRHDVRNKAQIARGYIELISASDVSAEEEDKYLQKTDRAIREAVELIEKVRTLREVEEREEAEEIWLDSALKNVLSEHQSKISENGIELDYNKIECKACTSPLLEELFSNIVENSIQHSDCSKISVSGEKREDECVVIIEDDGKGIPDEDKEKVFDREFKKGESAGSGLGLFMVKNIAESHGGKVEVKDSELGGARFDVRLTRACE